MARALYDTGLVAREDGAPVDFAALRRDRLDRVLAAMDENDLDVMILGRPANIRYAVGARQLWTAGTRAWGPACTITRDGGVHLLSTGDDGIPPEVPREHLIGMSWNPLTLAEALGSVEAVRRARRVGVDAMTVLFSQLLPTVVPDAELVDGEAVLARVRASKLSAEVACTVTALAIAEGVLVSTLDDLRPGTTERALRATYLRHAASEGVTVPALDPQFGVTEAGSTTRRFVSDRPIEAGDLVRCHVGVIHAGYEGSLIRTRACPDVDGRPVASSAVTELQQAWDRAMEALREACRPGATAEDLRGAYADAGGETPSVPVVHGLGCSFEPPVIWSDGDGTSAARLDAGMVLHLTASVGDGAYEASEVVHVQADWTEVLTRLGHGAPLAEAS